MRKLALMTSLLLLAILGIAGIAMGADNNIRFSSVAEIEVAELNDKGEKVLVREPAIMVPPGGLVIYTNAFTNLGDQPAENVVVNNPIPDNTEYLGGSATETGVELTFSADGGQTFAAPAALKIADGKGGTRPAAPSDYTDIRWKVLEPLAPGQTGIVEFRVRVK